MKVYLDNAATTYPKPEKVYSSILNYMKNVGASLVEVDMKMLLQEIEWSINVGSL